MYRFHNKCRACGTADLKKVFNLGLQPLANDFRTEMEVQAGYAPLEVLFCPQCCLAQLSVVVDPSILYQKYSYVTSNSNTMQDHFARLIADISAETNGVSVLEIGSNDGFFLEKMKKAGFIVLGIDPAENLAKIANERGIPTQIGLFSKSTSKGLSKYDIVIARHVFCHVDDWHDFIEGIENVAHSETLVCIEVPYVGDTLTNCEFDQIYHEHLSYLSLGSIEALLEKTSLRLYRVLDYPIHGGTILLMICRKDSRYEEKERCLENINEARWRKFAEMAKDQINCLSTTVRSSVAQGKRIAGLGASAKSTVWINACGFTNKEIQFIADNTLQKQSRFSPGSKIPIVDEGALLRERPDYVVMFAWNYKEELLKKFAVWKSYGGKFIIPFKTITVV